MKALLAIAMINLSVGCGQNANNTGGSTTISPKGTTNQNGSSVLRPYITEIIKKYATPVIVGQPYGLWNSENVLTFQEGKLTIDLFMRITEDTIAKIHVCVNKETKNHIIVPTEANVQLTKKDDGSHRFTLSQPLETNSEKDGITCRSWLPEGESIIRIDEAGMLLMKEAEDTQFTKMKRVK